MTFVDKRRLFQTSILGTILLATAPAYAQDADTSTDAPESADEELLELLEEDDEAFGDEDTIVVTGSRLRRNEFTSASPLQVIDGELARDLGLVEAADLLGQTTVVQGQQFTTGVSTSAAAGSGDQTVAPNGPGASNASLRGLNPNRTLVLINGRRLAPAGVRGVPSNPDLNMIPGSLIERVDVLLDGASSVYGSDAIAGVVNYQLRNNFDGIQLDAFATMPELPGNAGHQQLISLTTGITGDKGFMGFAVEHSRTDGYSEGDLADFYEPYSYGCRGRITRGGGGTGTLYAPDLCAGSFGAGSVSGAPGGFLRYEPGAQIAGFPANFTRVPIAQDLIQPDSIAGQGLLIFPEELDANFSPDFERTTLYTLGEYETGWYGDATFYFEGSYSERRTANNTAGQGAIDLTADYVLGNFGAPVALFFESDFSNETNVAQTRLIGGLKGDLPFLDNGIFSNWGYDFYASYSRSSGQDSIVGIPFLPRLEQTLANTRIDPATGEAVCDARSIPGNGQTIQCRPLDFFQPSFLFGGRFEDPDDTAYLFPNRLTDTEVTQTTYQGYISGELFDIPMGDTILVGLGAEFRRDFIETNTSLAGDFEGFLNDPGATGERDLTEFFGEIEIPLLADHPIAELLSVNGAVRYTDESNFGAETTYSIKGNYQPTDWLQFRASYGTSYRAPGLGEQFGGRITGQQNVLDPCETPGFAVPFGDYDNDPSTPETREYQADLDTRDPTILANCTNGGGPFNIPGTDITSLGIRGLGTATPVFLGTSAAVASGSNPNLEPETSNALSIGATFEQPFTDKFEFRAAVNYFEIELNGEIDQLTAVTIVNRCYQSPGLTDRTCGFLTRSPRVAGNDNSGLVDTVSALNQNLGQQIVEGIDYNIEFGFEYEKGIMDSPISYDFIGRATQMLTQTEEEILVDGTVLNRELGEYGNPEWRLNLTNIVRWKDFQFLFQSRYIDSMVENFLNVDESATGGLAGDVDVDPVTTFFSNCVAAEGARDADGNFNCFQADGLDSYWVHDMSFAFQRDTYVIRVGVNNVFNDAPPITDNSSIFALGGLGYDLGGRTYFANVTKRF
ncbi:MAG: TonB-dependent receptor [Pseudomonadota bacterium]